MTLNLFGISVSISGDSSIIGSFADDDGGSNSGSAFVFTRDDEIWTQQAKLTADTAVAGDLFGKSVSISNDIAVIGTDRWRPDKPESGSAYIFKRSDGIWSQSDKVKAYDSTPGDGFGRSVSISGYTAIIGSQYNDTIGTDAGAAYVYNFDFINPSVTITSPTSDPIWTTTESSLISLAGNASDTGGSGVASITWSNDRGGSGTATGTENWSVDEIPLQLGDNVITVTATDGKGNASTDVLTVTLPPGSVKATIEPAEAVTDGAQWSIDGGATWMDSGDNIAGLAAGDYTVQFKPLDGWITPEPQVVTVVDGPTTEISVSYMRQSIDASVVWVDFNYAGDEWGSEAQPYNTLAEGVLAVASGGTIRIKSGSSGTPSRITTPVRIEASGGPVTLGRGPVSVNQAISPADNSKGVVKATGQTGDLLNQKNAVIEWVEYE